MLSAAGQIADCAVSAGHSRARSTNMAMSEAIMTARPWTWTPSVTPGWLAAFGD